jgi:transposase
MTFDFTDEQLKGFPPEAQAIIRALAAEVKRLNARVAELEARLSKTPKNSSLPPSSQHPHAKPLPQKPKSKRKRGGQPGHKKHERELIPTEQCDHVETLKPKKCRRCRAKLLGVDPEPLRHQVWELPEIKPQVTEYQLHRLPCTCGATTCASLPSGVPRGQSGPRLIAFTALLMAYFRQSKRRTAEFLSTLLNQPCCPALTVKMQNMATAAVQAPRQELVEQLPAQRSIRGDETPMKEQNAKTWLWTFVATWFTVFAIRNSREATALDDLLTDEFQGVMICDRAKMYWRAKRLQWCWAHLMRDFQSLIDSGDSSAKHLGHGLRASSRRLFGHWADYRRGDISRAALQRRMGPVRRRIEKLLLRGAESGNKKYAGMCRELHEHREWLWTFLREEDVEPTNNASERALRHAVIWRKLSFGTQSAAGSRFMESMLTVIETCRQQGRSTFAYLTAAMESHLAKKPAPTQLPGA